MPEYVQLPRRRRGTKSYRAAVAAARRLAAERLAHFAGVYGIRHGAVSIRKQRTRWGSASTSGNLSFNFRIVYLPPELADYIVIHELCHLAHMNHSKQFWELVSRADPEWKKHRALLRRYRF